MDYSLEKLTNQQLDFINARFISPDKDMFSIKTVGAGFNTVIAERVINFILENCSSFYSGNTIVIINDLSLHMTKALIDAGISPKNIKLTFCKFDNKSKTLINNDSAISKIFKLHPVIRQNKDLEIITFEEVQSMKINGIIANPPYAAIGANITDKIRTVVDYDEYINLLPASDYKRNKNKDLFNYQSDMVTVENGFADAAVTTQLAKIHKEKANTLTLDEFNISNYDTVTFAKYFRVNITRDHYAYHGESFTTKCKDGIFSPKTTFILGWRDVNHHHMPKSTNCASYKWNVEESVDCDYMYREHANVVNAVLFYGLTFSTPEEKKNFTNFIYSEQGKKFCNKLWTIMSLDGTASWEYWMPKVDWSKPWSLEEILADYGYSEDEIKIAVAEVEGVEE